MKPFLLITTLAILSPSAFAGEVSIAAGSLEAYCAGYGSPRLYVKSEGNTIYQTTEYSIPYTPQNCEDDAAHLQTVFNAAADANLKMSFRPSGNNPRKDFKIADGKTAAISAIGLDVSCVGYYWKRLQIKDLGSRQVYLTTEYSIPYNDDDCYEAASKIRTIFNSARALGKKVTVRHTNTPEKDIELSDESDPMGRSSSLETEPSKDSDSVSAG